MNKLLKLFREFINNLNKCDAKLNQFGLVVGGIFIFFAILVEVSNGANMLALSLVVCGSVLLFFGYVKPRVLYYPYIAWMSLGFILGLFIAPIVLGIIYYLFFSPISLLRGLVSSDKSWVRYNRKAESYWQRDVNKYESSKSKNLY